MSVESSAEQKAAPGFAEFKFDDGSMVQVSAYNGLVTVLQQSGGTQGRGAAFVSAEQARQLAEAIHGAADVAEEQAAAQPAAAAPELAAAPTSAVPAAAEIDYDKLAAALERRAAAQKQGA